MQHYIFTVRLNESLKRVCDAKEDWFMKKIYICLAFIFLGIALVGAVLPLIPTTPFLLLASYYFAKGSQRFNIWFKSLPLYKKHLESFDNNREMTLHTKWSILIPVSLLLIFTIVIVPHVHAKIALCAVIVAKYVYFFKVIKTARTNHI